MFELINFRSFLEYSIFFMRAKITEWHFHFNRAIFSMASEGYLAFQMEFKPSHPVTGSIEWCLDSISAKNLCGIVPFIHESIFNIHSPHSFRHSKLILSVVGIFSSVTGEKIRLKG